MNSKSSPSCGRLAIIAGGGLLPSYVALAARLSGDDPVIIALKNEASLCWDDYDHAIVGVGDFATIRDLFKRYCVDRIVMSGSVRRRPEWKEIRPTFRSLLKMPGVVRTLLSGGDDKVLQMVIKLIEDDGRRVIGVQDIAPGLLAQTGILGIHKPDQDDRHDIHQAEQAAEILGRLDIGQGAISVGGRVVALEGPEGTDAMLERVAGLRAVGKISSRRRGVLVKLCKPQQDIRADLPSIGVSTIENAFKAGLAGVVVEAGRSLVLDRDEMIKTANQHGLFVAGLDRGLPSLGIDS